MSFILMWCSKFQTQSDGKTYPHIYYKQCDRIFLTEQGNIPRNVWMPCQGLAAMLFWVKLTCCLRERKISMKVQLYLQRWTPLRHSWVNHVFRAVGRLRMWSRKKGETRNWTLSNRQWQCLYPLISCNQIYISVHLQSSYNSALTIS